MAIVSRVIGGTVKNALGVIQKNKIVRFRPIYFGDDGIIVPPFEVQGRTNSSGVLKASNGTSDFALLTNDDEEAFVRYEVVLPDKTEKTFDLIAGAATTLDNLIAIYDGQAIVSDAAVLADLLERLTDLEENGIPSGSPTGAAGGVLGGNYPNPTFAVDMATQAELDTEKLRIAALEAAPPSASAWGDLTGSLPAQTDLQAALDAKQPLATVLTNTTASFTTADETKLDGIATGATANDSDANLKARANHTGTQAISTVTGLQSALDGKADDLGADDNYVTDAEKVKLSNLSGTNTGDQVLTPYFHKTNDDTDDITAGATNKFATAAEKTKLGHITVTQAVDLDAIESGLAGKVGQSEIDASIAALVDSSPGTLNTLNELAAALGDDPNFAATTATAIGLKADDSAVVHDTGNETVAGIKTFSSSPVVPTPTTDFQASTKKYVDDSITAGGGYTDEQAQDAVGNILDDSAEITLAYSDGTPSITASIVAGSIDETKLDASVNASLDLADSALQAADIGSSVQAYDAVLDATTASFTTADETKLDGIEAAADVTDAVNVGSSVHGATGKTTPVDADTVPLIDSAASNVLKKVTWANVKATLKTYFDTLYQPLNAVLTAFAALTQTNDNFLQVKSGSWAGRTIAQVKSDLGLTGTNSGDQTGIVGITGTKAQFDTAVTDGNFLYVGDVTTNATHTGEVTGSGALAIDKTAITGKTLVDAAVGDHVLISDASDSDNLKKVTVQTIVDLATGGGTVDSTVIEDSPNAVSGGAVFDELAALIQQEFVYEGDHFEGDITDASPFALKASVLTSLGKADTALQSADIGSTVQAYSANLAEYAAVNPTTAGLAILDDADAAAQRTTLGLDTTANQTDSSNKRFVTDAQATVIGNTSGTNSGNETLSTVAALLHGATAKTTPVDADEVPILDSAASFAGKRSTWTNIKAFLKTYFDTLYQPLNSTLTVLTTAFLPASSSNPARITLHEDTDTGTNSVTLWAPSSLGGDFALTLPGITDTLVSKVSTDTLQSKSIDLASNTLTGTKAQFNTAVTDGDVVFQSDSVGLNSGNISGDDQYHGITIQGTNAGATIAQWQAVYRDFTTGEWLLADANGSGTYPAWGLAVAGYSDNDPAIVLRQGFVRNDSWAWSAGPIYLSTTAGGLTQTAPSSTTEKIQVVGFAVSADIAFFDFDFAYLTVT